MQAAPSCPILFVSCACPMAAAFLFLAFHSSPLLPHGISAHSSLSLAPLVPLLVPSCHRDAQDLSSTPSVIALFLA